jgi:5-methylcytosine-specific restriction endonuclease McrA
MSGGTVYLTKLSHEDHQRWMSVKSHVIGQMGIKEMQVATAENFVALANTLYDLNVTATDFTAAVRHLFVAINGLSKSARRKLRKRNVSKIGYECRPHGAAVKKAALKAREARKFPPSERKIAATKAYHDKHLVLVTKDGEKIFNNVRQHSSPLARDEFYKSWDWRTLRMKTIKKFGRRCQCCGATPSDMTVDGKPVRIVVDHIKPISKYWQLRLVPSNLQILCDECNQGKGAWDETDYRVAESEAAPEVVDPLVAEYREIMREDAGHRAASHSPLPAGLMS